MAPGDPFTLMDWKRRVFDLYARVRATGDAREAWVLWRDTRSELFTSHPQSPVPEEARSNWSGLHYFDHDPSARVLAKLHEAEPLGFDIPTSGNEAMSFTRIADATFSLHDKDLSLEVYWLEGYGGGLFLPFRDSTGGSETYGAGRYLLDTVKGADLGMEDDRLVIDFNFAYNPSCAYDPRWVCPLAPPPNRLDLPVRAGERAPVAGTSTLSPS